jgi:hypothetical protein
MADPDGDGRLNFEEFALATDPLVADQPDVSFAWSIDGADRYAALRVRRPELAEGILYELLASETLAEPWTPVATLPVTTDPLDYGLQHATYRDLLPATGPAKFLRLRVTWAP